MPPAEDLERAIDDLFSGSPDGFTGTRNALAKRLRDEGDDEGARRVRVLKKPVRSAWAVNRLVREDRESVDALASVGDRLRAAQLRALSGAGADELRRRSDERRKLVGTLTSRAAELLGPNPPAATVEEISATFEAASADEEAARAVLEGRLSKPLARPAGFGDITGFQAIAGQGARTEAVSVEADERAERQRRERELRGAEERERRSRATVERLRSELSTLQERVSDAKDRLRAAEAEARGAALEVRRLRR